MDIQAFLDEAEEAAEILNEDAADNIGLALGAALGGTNPLRDKIVIAEDGSGIVGFADWAEQLIAESTGKLGTGVLPVVAGPASPEATLGAPDVLVVRLVAADADVELGENEVAIAGGLATQMMVWEFATAVAGRLLGINPYDQPDVEAAKIAARGLLDAQPEPTPASLHRRRHRGPRRGLARRRRHGGRSRQRPARRTGPGQLPQRPGLLRPARLRAASKASGTSWPRVSGRPVTFGWGPRFLHSTGQFHKGGPAIGVFLQVTAASADGPGHPGPSRSRFGELISAQAAGDAQVLAEHGRPVLRLHLTDRAAGVPQLQELVAALAGQAVSSTES